MSDNIKFIVQQLNQPPFNKKLNLISFDSLRSELLLQILNDVFAEIDFKMKADIRSDDPEQTVVRMLGFLRILKYKPPPDMELSGFRQGLVSGNKDVIYHILEWLLNRIPELKKRSYLARFLVKIDLGLDVEGDADVLDLYQEYEQLIEEFKEVHKQYELLKGSGYSTSEIRKDLTHMEEERDQLTKKIERLKRKVDSQPQKDAMLGVARDLREEKDRAEQQSRQKAEQKTLLQHAEQKIQRLTQQVKDLKNSSLGATPEGIFHKLEEEVKVNLYLIKEKLPKEIVNKQKYIDDMQKVVHEPAMGKSELDNFNAKIQAVNVEVNKLIEKRMMSTDPIDDKLTLFRQQAAIVARKKDAAAEQLSELKSEMNQIQEELTEKKEQLKGFEGEVVRGDEFKKYVNKLRTKSTTYKKKRQELAEVKAEIGVLARSDEILQQRGKSVSDSLSAVEGQHGVEGYHATQEELEKVSTMKAQLDERKGKTLEDMATLVRRLNAKIVEKKAKLAPIIKELRPLRQQSQDLSYEYDKKKSYYDSCYAGLESNMAKLEQDVAACKQDVMHEESRHHYLNCMIEVLDARQEVLADEIKSYVSGDNQDKKRSMREQLNKLIQDQEHQAKVFKEKQKEMKENEGANIKQMKMWRDLQFLLDCKKQGFETAAQNRQKLRTAAANATSDRLVL